MKFSELKKLCRESLLLFYDIKIDESKIGSRRVVLFGVSDKNLNSNKLRLAKMNETLEKFSPLFETDVKTLRNVIWQELLNSQNVFLKIEKKGEYTKVVKTDDLIEHEIVKNIYVLNLHKGKVCLPVVEFVSTEDAANCENEKINLLTGGFVRSSKFKMEVENLERFVPGFQSLLWGIVEENVKNFAVKNDDQTNNEININNYNIELKDK